MKSKSRQSSKDKKNTQDAAPDTEELETPKALLNDVILQNIFKYLGYKDLKWCRNVKNCQWLKNSKKVWWSRTKIVFPRNDWHSLQEKLTDYLKQTDIASNATNYAFDVFTDTFEFFWEKLGPLIKHLEFGMVRFHSLDAFRKLLYSHCPNLEKLVLRSFTVANVNQSTIVEPSTWEEPQFGQQTNLKFLAIRGTPMPVTWTEVLSHFPNLQALEATVDNDDIYKAISIIRHHDQKRLKLNHIKIFITPSRGRTYESIRSVVLDPNLSFKTIVINAAQCENETVLDILDLHAKSLKELTINGKLTPFPDFGSNETQLKLPRQPLEMLDELRIHNCSFSIDIFKCIPNVRKVTLFENHFPEDSSMAKPNVKVNACKELRLFPNLYYDWTLDSNFEMCLNMFPNVEIFETTLLDNVRFSMICERLKKLKTFKVSSHCKVDVLGLLGFDPDSNKAEDGTRKANITDLKDLQSFSAFGSLYGKKLPEMKNGSVILKELEKLPHLKKFKLENYKLEGEPETWKKIFDKYAGN